MTDPTGESPPVTDLRSKPSYEEAYRALKDRFMERLGNNIAAIDNIMAQRQTRPLTKAELARAMMLAHGLAGSGTTFGFPAITDAGRKLDSFLEKITRNMPENGTLDDSQHEEFAAMMGVLRKNCHDALSGGVPAAQALATKPADNDIKDVYHVLLVDDDENILDIVSLKLRQTGVRVSIARSGDAALLAISKEIPDMIVLDIMMPGISGHEVLRRLKQDPDFVAVPVIMLTAQTEQKDVVSALHSGAIDYVIKPVDPEKLVAHIGRTLDAARYTVMIADNDPLILQLLGSKYRHRGFKVLSADDGKAAWSQILKTLPDLVILDRMMPGMDGVAVLKNIRQEEATRNIPVIILSARKEERDIEIGMNFGASDYVVKPFLPDDLMTRSLRLLKKVSKNQG